MSARRWLLVVGLVLAFALVWLLPRDVRSRHDAGEHASASEGAEGVVEEAVIAPAAEIDASSVSSERQELAPPTAPTAPALAACSLRVTVKDPKGAPLAEARVTGSAESGWSELRVTGADGTAELAPPLALDTLTLQFEREGYEYRRIERDARKPVVVVLYPVLVLTGRVLDADTSAPIADAVVEREHGNCTGCPLDRATMGADGRYRLAGVPCGHDAPVAAYFVRAAGYAGQRFTFVVHETASEVEHDFALHARGEITGRVVDWVSGAPIPGARVRIGVDVLRTDRSGSFSSSSSAALGEPASTRLGPGCMIEAPGYVALWIPLERLESPVFARLPEGARIAGVVRVAGRPAPGARLVLANGWFSPSAFSHTPYAQLPEGWMVSDAPRAARADAEGRYSFEGVLPWCDTHEVSTELAGFEVIRSTPRVLEPGEELTLDLDFERAPGGSISGEFTFNGKPAYGSVVCTGDARQSKRKALSTKRTAEPPASKEFTARVVDGRYRIEGVPPGSWQLVAHLTNPQLGGFLPQTSVAIEVERGRELHQDFHLELPMAPISGRVLHDDGTPEAGASLTARAEKRGRRARSRARRTWTSCSRRSVCSRSAYSTAVRTPPCRRSSSPGGRREQ